MTATLRFPGVVLIASPIAIEHARTRATRPPRMTGTMIDIVRRVRQGDALLINASGGVVRRPYFPSDDNARGGRVYRKPNLLAKLEVLGLIRWMPLDRPIRAGIGTRSRIHATHRAVYTGPES